MSTLRWRGADNGREGLTKADKWFKTLTILGRHEGEAINNYSSSLYLDLYAALPNESWLGREGNRSLFRDYQKIWTSLGVMHPTENTGHLICLTPLGRQLIETGELTEFFRNAVDDYTELWEVSEQLILFSPYETIAHALLLFPDPSAVRLDQLQEKAELLASVSISKDKLLRFTEGDTAKRRFRSYLTMLENTGAIERQHGGTVCIHDRAYLHSLVREGELILAPSAAARKTEWFVTTMETLPDDIVSDLRKRKQSSGIVREGQKQFSRDVRKAYNSTCCITGTKEPSVLQAAHIIEYRGRQTNFVNNGLLLAQDIHTMFDRGRLLINPSSLEIEFPPDVSDQRYTRYAGMRIALPASSDYWPNRQALARRYELALAQ